jgi:hypothetical protein
VRRGGSVIACVTPDAKMATLGITIRRKVDVSSLRVQERDERVQEAIDHIDKVMQRWKHRITPTRIELGKWFMMGQIYALVHVRGIVEPNEMWVATYQKKFSSKAEFPNPLSGSKDTLANGDEHSMFTEVVKAMEETDSIVPAIVRLDRVDDFYCSRVHKLYFSASLGLFVSGGVLCERKPALLQNHERGIRRIGVDQLVTEVVECSPQIPDHIAGCSKSVHRDSERVAHAPQGGLSVLINPNTVTVEPVKPDLHIEEILFGPFNFSLD